MTKDVTFRKICGKLGLKPYPAELFRGVLGEGTQDCVFILSLARQLLTTLC